MGNYQFGWIDLAYWIVAFAVAYYVAFVLDIQKFFMTAKEEDSSKIKGPKKAKDNSLMLEKSKVAEKLAFDLHNDSKARNVPMQTNPLESFNFEAFNQFKNDYPVVIIVDGRCQELEKFIASCSNDDGKVHAYSRTFLNNISFAAYAVDAQESSALNEQLNRIGAKTMYSQKATDNFFTWKEHLFANLETKKYK